jgi:phosphoenolpyruvate---glycerone phosphotransferase subunit DhaL
VTGPALSAILSAVATALVDARDELNRLDGIAGDGDLGLTASRAAEALLELAPTVDDMDPRAAAKALGMTLARRAPSTGGTLIAFACLAAAKTDLPADGSDLEVVTTLREASRAEMATRGKVAPGDRTMLDALGPAVDSFRAAVEERQSAAGAVRAAADAADLGAAATAGMEATTGRAGWLADRARGHEDAGARLVAVVFAAAARALEAGTQGT